MQEKRGLDGWRAADEERRLRKERKEEEK